MKNRKYILNLWLVLLFFFLSQSIFSQYLLQVKLTQPPPNQLRASDIWKLTLINSGRTTLQITLHGTLEEAGAGIIVEGNSNLLSLPPGMKTITYDDVKSGNVNFKSGKWREAFTRTGNAPSGDYTICVYIKNEEGEEIGSDCIEQIIEISAPPSLISPSDGETIPAEKPLLFTWLSPVPVPREKITYEIKIVEIIGNQSPEAAIQRNRAWFEKSDIRSTMFQYPVSAKKIEADKKYAWVVTVGELKSEVFIFDRWDDIDIVHDDKLSLTSPANGEEIGSEAITFKWETGSTGPYKIKIVEIIGDQSPEEAIQRNKAFFEKEDIRMTMFQYPSSAPKLRDGKKYGWNVQPIGGNNGTSEISSFTVKPVVISTPVNPSTIKLVFPLDSDSIDIARPVTFTWVSSQQTSSVTTYNIKIVEITGDQSPEQSMVRNKAFFEKDSVIGQTFQYPSSAPRFEEGKSYSWQVNSGDIKSDVSIFDRWCENCTNKGKELILSSPANGEEIGPEAITFKWETGSTGPYKIKIVEMVPPDVPVEELLLNKAFFEKEDIRMTSFQYPSFAPKLEEGKKYVWNVKTADQKDYKSKAFTFVIMSTTEKSKFDPQPTDSVMHRSKTHPSDSVMLPPIIFPSDSVGEVPPKIQPSDSVMQPMIQPSDSIMLRPIIFPSDSVGEVPPKIQPSDSVMQPMIQPSDSIMLRPIIFPSDSVGEVPPKIQPSDSVMQTMIQPSDSIMLRPIIYPSDDAVGNKERIKLLSPPEGEDVDSDLITFKWETGLTGPYKIKIVEIIGNQSPEEAILRSKSFFEKDDIRQQIFQYPASAPKLGEGKKYAWQITAYIKNDEIGKSELWSFYFNTKVFPVEIAEIKNCDVFKVELKKTNQNDDLSYKLLITNNYEGKFAANKPASFRITVKGDSISSIAGDMQDGWKRTPSKFPPASSGVNWINVSRDIPNGETDLGNLKFRDNYSNPIKIIYEWLDNKGKIICKDSVEIGSESVACRNNLIRNGGFVQENVEGVMPSPGAVKSWTRGYGSPKVDNNPNEGFIEQGFIKLSGNVVTGEAIAQELDPNNKIVMGKKYKLSAAVKFLSSQNSLDYVKIQAIAFNGSIFSTYGNHPLPNSNVAIIGRSGKIRDCGDWSVIEFPVWAANKDFLNIAIYAFTNSTDNAEVLIDNINLCETMQDECDEIQLDNSGNPIVPAGFGDVPSGFTCQPEAEDDEYYTGSLQDLYPGYNGTTDSAFYSETTNSCFTIGGTLPPEITNYSCDDSLKAAGINMTCVELEAMLNKPFEPIEIKKVPYQPILPLVDNICDRPGPKNMENMPFNGRDIIYIHGLQIDHIIDRALGKQGATGHWPNNQSEFNTGYYFNVAVNNMLPHIYHFLRNRGNLNRFLIVSYDCSESAEVAVHNVLTQIREAMENGTGVQVDPSDPRGKNCFGRDYVFISHSTGAIVADVALSIANKTKTDLSLKTEYGDIGLISDRCKGRVSIQGAYSGSNLAKIACMLQDIDPVLFAVAINAMAFTPVNSWTLNSLPSQLISNSILVDLVPEISRARWGSYINDITVPVFTLAGGHPSAILGPLKYSIIPGFDDGVLSMDCANGNNNPLSLGHSSFKADPKKVFDMGIPLIRGIAYYADQRISEGVFAATSTAYLSPTGMVQPVSSILVDPQNHFNNHYSFIQSSKEHWFNTTEPGSGNIPCDYKRTSPGGYTNNEEMLVVTNSSLFSPGLIDPAIISQMGETIKGLHISYPTLKIVYRRGLPKLTVFWKKFYIWKRTYHKLNDNCMYDVDYAYKYLFK
ncbi:hypothetical protein ASZ90_004043 [hydrocarbon metagenome]|uniref:Uncharacterized protein n=1 Tax=hydrocarbon metagenome TaxID=938273 RepID=A0A0W8FZ60_9ZZZZ